MLSTFLLALGGVAALVAIIFGIVGGLVDRDQPASLALATAGTPIALGGLALIALGGILRYCSYCCDDDCDWDEEDDSKSASTSP